MEKAFKYYQIAASEDSTECALILCCKVTATKLPAWIIKPWKMHRP